MKQNVRVLIYPEDDGYCVLCHDLHAYTQGDTLQEALANMNEAIALAMEGENLAELGFSDDPSLLVEIELGSARRHTADVGIRRAG
jgi:predicted RNase H-like HicB family nuclease